MKILFNRIGQSRYFGLIMLSSLALGLFYLYQYIQRNNFSFDPTAGYIDPTIWILVLISIMCFITLIGLSALLLTQLFKVIGLPAPGNMVSHFNSLQSWQKLSLLFASYALLLLAGVGCLIAIC